MASSNISGKTTSDDSRRSFWIWGLPLVGTVLVSILILGTSIPLGIPGEWVWNRQPLAADYWWNFPLFLIVIGLSAILIWWVEGQVTLHGTVSNYYLKQVAQTVAYRQSGVGSLANRIRVARPVLSGATD